MELGSNSPWLQYLSESLEKIRSVPWGHTCPDLLWQPSKAERIQECWQVLSDCRRSRKWGCRGRLALGFKPRCSSHTRERTTQLWQSGDPVAGTQLMVPGAWITDFYFFSWDMVPRTGQREKEGLCVSVGILKDFSILMKT